MSDSIKMRVHQRCIETLETKIATLQKSIQDAQQAASVYTKSSAGDKFETGREMINQEVNKLGTQLSQATEMLNALQQINPALKRDRVEYGSLVHTNEGNYYFSVSLGKILLDNQPHFALSLVSPIGKALLNKEAGHRVVFMGREIKIGAVL